MASAVDGQTEIVSNKHKFSTTASARITAARKKAEDYLFGLRGLGCLIEDAAVVTSLVALTTFASAAHAALGWTVYMVVAVPLIGARQRALADVMHQASHKTASKWEYLNTLIGWLAGWPVLQHLGLYSLTHARNHHAYNGNVKGPNGIPGDPDVAYQFEQGLYSPDVTKEHVEAYIGDMFTIRAVLAYMVYLCKNRMLAPEIFESPLLAETALRFAFYCGVVAVAWSCGGLAALFWFWVVPLVTAANLIGAWLEMFEHYPLATQKYDLVKTRNRICSLFADAYLGVHWEGLHLVHHLFPRLPSWALLDVHRILMEEDAVYRAWNRKELVEGWANLYSAVTDVGAARKDLYAGLLGGANGPANAGCASATVALPEGSQPA